MFAARPILCAAGVGIGACAFAMTANAGQILPARDAAAHAPRYTPYPLPPSDGLASGPVVFHLGLPGPLGALNLDTRSLAAGAASLLARADAGPASAETAPSFFLYGPRSDREPRLAHGRDEEQSSTSTPLAAAPLPSAALLGAAGLAALLGCSPRRRTAPFDRLATIR